MLICCCLCFLDSNSPHIQIELEITRVLFLCIHQKRSRTNRLSICEPIFYLQNILLGTFIKREQTVEIYMNQFSFHKTQTMLLRLISWIHETSYLELILIRSIHIMWTTDIFINTLGTIILCIHLFCLDVYIHLFAFSDDGDFNLTTTKQKPKWNQCKLHRNPTHINVYCKTQIESQGTQQSIRKPQKWYCVSWRCMIILALKSQEQ